MKTIEELLKEQQETKQAILMIEAQIENQKFDSQRKAIFEAVEVLKPLQNLPVGSFLTIPKVGTATKNNDNGKESFNVSLTSKKEETIETLLVEQESITLKLADIKTKIDNIRNEDQRKPILEIIEGLKASNLPVGMFVNVPGIGTVRKLIDGTFETKFFSQADGIVESSDLKGRQVRVNGIVYGNFGLAYKATEAGIEDAPTTAQAKTALLAKFKRVEVAEKAKEGVTVKI